MTAVSMKKQSRDVADSRRIRFDAPEAAADGNATYLRLWAAREAARYRDLLMTISAAPKPAPAHQEACRGGMTDDQQPMTRGRACRPGGQTLTRSA